MKIMFNLLLTLTVLCGVSFELIARAPDQCGLQLQLAVGAAIDQSQVDMIIQSSAVATPEFQRRLLTLIAVESSFRPDSVSGRGAVGLTQTLPIARAEVDQQWPGAAPQLPTEADVWYGSSYLRWCHERYGSWTVAYMCYHSGPRRTDQYLRDGTLPTETLYYVARMWRLYEENCR